MLRGGESSSSRADLKPVLVIALKARKDFETVRRSCVPPRRMSDYCEDALMSALLCECNILDMFVVTTDSDHERRK